jgi:GNAT superfamily N-acetyltransferase
VPVSNRASDWRVRVALRTRPKRWLTRIVWGLRADADRRALLAAHLKGARDFNRIVCKSHEDARIFELDGVSAAMLPAAAECAEVNLACYESSASLSNAVEPLTAAYDEAGITAWLLTGPPVDRASRRALRRHGYRLQSTPLIMGRPLTGLERPPPEALEDWTAEGDPAVMAEVADRAFDLYDAFERAYSQLAADRAHVYLARSNGEAGASILATDFKRHCSIDLVATLPAMRGLGLATGLLGHALADAAERGCTTATLSSSEMARGVYERSGFTGLGPFEHWEMQVKA